MPDEHGPLFALARRMRSRGPPSLAVLVARLGEMEEYGDFINLVREFLPEREEDILRELTPAHQIAAFASYFEDRYFPLYDNFKLGEAETYYELVRGIPVIVRGLSWDDYNEIPTYYNPGIQLMTYLLESPYEDGDVRVALAEACQEHVTAELLRQVPEGGLSLAETHELLDDTPYKALAIWGDVVCASTGNPFLDTDWEMLGYNGEPPWEREVVEDLTQKWLEADLIHKEVGDLAEWLEGDPTTRFGEIVNFITERR